MSIRKRWCSQCSGFTETPALWCDHCGSDINFKEFHKVTDNNTVVRTFPSGYFRDIADEPIYIKGRKQLLAETRARGQVSMYAED